MDTDRKQGKPLAPRSVDVASMVKDATDQAGSISVGRFHQNLHATVQAALDAGERVTLYADGKPANIVAIERSMLRDEKGQRWGAMTLMSDPDGRHGNRLTIGAVGQAPERAPSTHGAPAQSLSALADARSDVRAHVAQVRGWSPEEAARQAAADLSAYHAPRDSRAGDTNAMQHLRKDMALRSRNSEPYRAELQRLDPGTLRDVLLQPIASRGRGGPEPTEQAQPSSRSHEAGSSTPQQRAVPAKEEPGKAAGTPENIVAAVTGLKRSVESELDAQQRQAAKATIGANDRQGDAKRDVIDHMTSDELKRFTAAGADKSKAEQVLREAASREERAAATGAVREPVPPLAERFNITRRLFTKEYEFRDQPGKVAFSERFNTLRSGHNTPTAAIAMIDRAGERGWSTVRLTGAAEFVRQAWIAAEARGIKAIGYEPTKGDIEAARAERERLGKTAQWQGGMVERAADRAASVPDRAPDRTADRTADRPPAEAARDGTRPASEQSGQRNDARTLEPLIAAAASARQSEEAIRRDPNTDDERRSLAKEERKVAEFAAMTDRAAPEQASNGKAANSSLEPVVADIPSLAAASASRDSKAAERNDKERDPSRSNAEKHRERSDRTDERLVRGVGAVAFMRALEQVMERDGVPQQLRPEIRTVAQAQFAALRAEGKTVRVPLVDRTAPRRVPVQLPHHDIKRAAQERTR